MQAQIQLQLQLDIQLHRYRDTQIQVQVQVTGRINGPCGWGETPVMTADIKPTNGHAWIYSKNTSTSPAEPTHVWLTPALIQVQNTEHSATPATRGGQGRRKVGEGEEGRGRCQHCR
jgi:hypothetical protein